MSDDISNLKKYKLPNISLKPNNGIEINGKNNYYAIGEYISNFNLSKYETLYLNDGYNIIDSVVIPRMSSNEYYGRYLDSNRFVYYLK